MSLEKKSQYTQRNLEREFVERLRNEGTSEEDIMKVLETPGLYADFDEYKIKTELARYRINQQIIKPKNIVKEDLRKVAGGFLELFLSLPTLVRQMNESPPYSDDKSEGRLILSLLVNAIGGGFLYSHLFETHPKLAPFVLSTHIASNVANGFYEWYRHVKKRSLEKYSEE